ncbi:hypothetical protein BO82DRAFT_402820 [Aspergillus uvarum CBS 121591]|uniref:Uncharacterized protein n=1 Tax=Aspergillus uvarum CBS 121591 TaxID=1448315 RepID=A0A319C6L0_9EURO|nr:hypothetical protein BO82DRAFT_402820 [Aspergillus uvarum CBS 121591]PYH80955.1 hypothetical protein BO82DRAFT_402820 [Aspergillus uvarum CBS 121591]
MNNGCCPVRHEPVYGGLSDAHPKPLPLRYAYHCLAAWLGLVIFIPSTWLIGADERRSDATVKPLHHSLIKTVKGRETPTLHSWSINCSLVRLWLRPRPAITTAEFRRQDALPGFWAGNGSFSCAALST